MERQQIQIFFFKLGRSEDIVDFVPNVGQALAVVTFHFDRQDEALREFILQVLCRSQTLELPCHHYRDSGAKCFAFFHAVGSQHN